MEVHVCKLTRLDVPVLNYVIEAGVFIKLRRSFAKFVLINKNHPLCMTYYRSNSARRRQELKHLAHFFPPMIHPFSMAALYWEFFVSAIYLMIFLMQTIVSVETDEESRYYARRVRFAFDVVFFADIIKTFITGYYDVEKSRTVLEPLMVAAKYIKSYFFLDVFCLSYSITIVVRSIIYENGFMESAYINLIEFCVYFRIITLNRWTKALHLLCLYIGLKSIFSRTFRMMLTYVIIIIVILAVIIEAEGYTNYIYEILIIDEPRKVKSYFSAVCILFLINAGRKSFDFILKKLITICFMFMGFCMHAFLYIQIMKIWNKYASARSKNQGLLQQFREFMRYKGLPIHLREKIYLFFSFKYQNQFYNEDQINKMVSQLLRQEILLYITQHHIEKVKFFQNLPEVVLYKIVALLKSEIFLTDDIIVTAGETGDRMFFIYFGTVAVYSQNGLEICHLEDGSHFGEIALVFNETRIATVVAVTPCELFTLNSSDFLDVLDAYPQIKAQIWDIAAARFHSSQGLDEIIAKNTENKEILDESNEREQKGDENATEISTLI